MEETENKPFFENWRKKLVVFVENQAKEIKIKDLENQVAYLEKRLLEKEKVEIKISKSQQPINISFSMRLD